MQRYVSPFHLLQRMKDIEEIQAKTPCYDKMDDAVENVHHEVPSGSSNKESANENSSGSSSDIFTTKYTIESD